MPGAFVSDEDFRSWSSLSSDVQASPPQPGNPSLNPHVPKATSSLYTPSAYSIGAASGTSARPPVQSPRSHKSYEALVVSPGKTHDISNESGKFAIKLDSQSGSSTTSTSTLQLPMTRKQNSLTALSPTRVPPSDDDSDRLLQPSAAAIGLQRAVTGMEDLMKKAIDIATDAVDHQHSPSLSSRMDPLLVSDSMDASSSESATESATLSPKTSHPSHTVVAAGSSGEAANTVRGLRMHNTTQPSFPRDNSSESSAIVVSPKQSYERKSVESIVTDWAYVKSNMPARLQSPSPASSSSSTSAQSDVERKSTHWRAWHNNTKRPMYPGSASSASRHVRSKLSSPTGKEVHEHIKQHGVPPTPPRNSSLRHRNINDAASHARRSRVSDHSNQVRNRRKENRSERHEKDGGLKRRKLQYPGDMTSSQPSKGFEMGSPARTHISYRGAQEMESFGRHRRQPIARNWGTTKKRITATIACINTGLVGFLIGVYVSGCSTAVLPWLIWNRRERFRESSMPLPIRGTLPLWETSCEQHAPVDGFLC